MTQTTITNLVLAPVAVDDAGAIDEWLELERAVWAADLSDDPPPCPVYHRAKLSAPRPGSDDRTWLARLDGVVAGRALLSLPTLDNPDNAEADLVVHPEYRRRGIGRRLLAHLTEAARAAGRIRLILGAREPFDEPGPGARFLAATGAHKALANQRRRLLLPPDEAGIARLADAAREASAGYELMQWTGDTPERWLDDIAVLTGRMSTDAPLDDLHVDPEHFDAERIRGRDAAARARGLRRTVTAVRGPDGRLVGFSDIHVRASADWHGGQGDTIVDPAHRGHRLGMLLKTANLSLTRREHPALRMIDTCNADSNPYMVSINEAMGFRPLDRLGEWEVDL